MRNGIFEPIWNRNYIDHVQITAAETLGVEGRGPFYEKAGALRDVVQNHVMELLSFVAMEPPSSFEAEAVRREKVKVWRAIPSDPDPECGARAVRPGRRRRQEALPAIATKSASNPESGTETYAAVRLEIENWRWAGVPFYLRAGKRLKKRATEISIQFKQPPLLIFNRMQASGPCSEIQPNLLTIRIQPDEGIALRFGAKVPDHARHGGVPGESWISITRRPLAGRRRTGTSACCWTPCSATRRCLRIATAWRPPGRLYTPILEAWAAKNPEVFPELFRGHVGTGLRRPPAGTRWLHLEE